MDVEFVSARDAINRHKHGLSLLFGVAVLENPVGQLADDHHSYGEDRINAFGLVQGRLSDCTYALRTGVYRITSVRKANSREQSAWLS